MSNKEKLIIFLLASVNFTHIIDFMIMMPLGPVLKEKFALTPHSFSIIISSYAIAAFVSSFSAATYVDKFDRKKVLLFGYSGFILATFACGIADSFVLLMAARIMAGFFGGLIGAQVMSMVADTFPMERRGQAMGIMMGAFGAASVLGVPMALKLAEYGWHTPFTVLSGLSLVVLLLALRFVPSMTKHITEKAKTANPFDVFTRIIADNNQRMALTMSFVLMFSHFSVISFMATYMHTNVGFSQEDMKFIYFFGGLASLVSGPIIGKMADKFGKFKVFSVFAAIAVIPVLIITNLGHTPLYLALILSSVFFIISGGRIIPSQALMSSVVKPEFRGGFMSVNSSLQQLSSGLAAYVSGMIVIETATGELINYNYIGYFAAALSLVCIWLGWKLVEKG